MVRAVVAVLTLAAAAFGVSWFLRGVALQHERSSPSPAVPTTLEARSAGLTQGEVQAAATGPPPSAVVIEIPKWTSADVQAVTGRLGFQRPEGPRGDSESFYVFDGRTHIDVDLLGDSTDLTEVRLLVECKEAVGLEGNVWRSVLWRLLQKFFQDDYDKAKEWFVDKLGSAQQLPDEWFSQKFPHGRIAFKFLRTTSEKSEHDRLGRATARWNVRGVALALVLSPPVTQQDVAGSADHSLEKAAAK